MNLLKKLWNFLFGKKEEEAIEEVDLNKFMIQKNQKKQFNTADLI